VLLNTSLARLAPLTSTSFSSPARVRLKGEPIVDSSVTSPVASAFSIVDAGTDADPFASGSGVKSDVAAGEGDFCVANDGDGAANGSAEA
jgi:hypothetical protein